MLSNIRSDITVKGTSNKLRTYAKIKNSIVIEDYLIYNLSWSHKRALAKIRLSDHKLRIERGRHHKPSLPPEQRTCFTCKDQVENEIHFIVECPLYAASREKYNIVSFSESAEHFVKLFTSKDIKMLKNLSDYIKDALLLRDSKFHPNTRSHTNDASDG